MLFIGCFIIGIVWVIGIMPVLSTSGWFVNLDPLYAYPVYNIGFLFLTSGIFGGLINSLMYGRSNLTNAVKYSVASWLGFSMILDMWMAPYYMGVSSNVNYSLGSESLSNTSVDAFAAAVWKYVAPEQISLNLFGISVWFLLVYVATPILAFLVMIFLLKPSAVIGMFGWIGGRRRRY